MLSTARDRRILRGDERFGKRERRETESERDREREKVREESMKRPTAGR